MPEWQPILSPRFLWVIHLCLSEQELQEQKLLI